jgi:hypothetical protein
VEEAKRRKKIKSLKLIMKISVNGHMLRNDDGQVREVKLQVRTRTHTHTHTRTHARTHTHAHTHTHTCFATRTDRFTRSNYRFRYAVVSGQTHTSMRTDM